MTALLTVEGLGVQFPVGSWPRRKLLRASFDVSFSVARGEIVALVGESGSGKSTIGRVVARILPSQAGKVTLHGADPTRSESFGAGETRASMSWRQRVQLIFQDPSASLNPVFRVGHPVERALLLHGKATAATVAERTAAALEAVGLHPGAELAQRYPYQLSGGQRQRVAIARALATEPDLVVADEPTSMLDVSIRMDVLRLFARMRDEAQRSVLLVTHDLASARVVADRVIVLYAGEVMEVGPAASVLNAPRHPYAQLLAAAAHRGTRATTTLPAKPGAAKVIDPGPGCAFAARCLQAEARCTQERPPMVQAAPLHSVRCHLVRPA